MTTRPPLSPTPHITLLVSVVDFARHHGVTRQAVYKWEALGWLVRAGSKIALEPSSARVAQFRDPADSRASRKPAAKTAPVAPPPPHAAQPALIAASPTVWDPEVPPVPFGAAHAAEALATGSATTEQARRVKQNYRALKGKLEYELAAGGLLDMDTAKQILFDEFRAVRNHWMGWPSRYAAQIAADLNVEADRVTDVLTQYVHRHISEISEPNGQFRRG